MMIQIFFSLFDVAGIEGLLGGAPVGWPFGGWSQLFLR